MINNRNTTTADTNSPFAQEVQGTVAKLLSKENITIHRSYSYRTAFFDIEKRQLGLPILDNVPRDVYDLFIGHEIGHALWTRMDNFDSFKAQFGNKHLYNVLEDIRIEKLSQSAYPGLIQCFKRGYRHLYENGFFGDTSESRINGLNFLDRLNLVAKLGKELVDPTFTEEEKILLNEAMGIKTHADVERVARLILDHTSNNPEEQPDPANNDNLQKNMSDENTNEEQQGDDSESMESDENAKDDGEESFTNNTKNDSDEKLDQSNSENVDSSDDTEENQESSDGNESSSAQNMDDDYPELESETQKEFEKNLEKNRVSEEDICRTSCDFQFREPDKNIIQNSIFDYKKIFSLRDNDPTYILKKGYFTTPDCVREYSSFNKTTKKMVSILRNEFEQKKAAYEYSRSKISKRGTINVNAIHKYKFSEDIFSSVTELAQARSHGIVFLVDYSGSMYDSLGEILKKILILTDFCKSLSIPFEVYGFTTNNDITAFDVEDDQVDVRMAKMLNLLSSSMTKAEYQRAHRDLYFQSLNPTDPLSKIEALGGTPLLESLVISHYLVKEFKKKHSIQIANFMVLSDGEGNDIMFNRKINYYDYYTGKTIPGNAYGKIFGGKWFKFSLTARRLRSTYYENMEAILQNMKDSLNVNTMCFYVAPYAYKLNDKIHDIAANVYPDYTDQSKLKTQLKNELSKNLICHIEKAIGYDKYILMANAKNKASAGDDDYESFDEVSIDENASEKDIQKMFLKYSKSNKSSKIFAKEFIETISKNF